MRFLLDENVHAKLLPYLASLGHEARLVKKGTDDRVAAVQAKAESRIIITHDADFADQGRHPLASHCGVILLRMNNLYIEKIKVALDALFSEVPEAGLRARIFFVLEGGFKDVTMEEIPFDSRA